MAKIFFRKSILLAYDFEPHNFVNLCVRLISEVN